MERINNLIFFKYIFFVLIMLFLISPFKAGAQMLDENGCLQLPEDIVHDLLNNGKELVCIKTCDDCLSQFPHNYILNINNYAKNTDADGLCCKMLNNTLDRNPPCIDIPDDLTAYLKVAGFNDCIRQSTDCLIFSPETANRARCIGYYAVSAGRYQYCLDSSNGGEFNGKCFSIFASLTGNKGACDWVYDRDRLECLSGFIMEDIMLECQAHKIEKEKSDCIIGAIKDSNLLEVKKIIGHCGNSFKEGETRLGRGLYQRCVERWSGINDGLLMCGDFLNGKETDRCTYESALAAAEAGQYSFFCSYLSKEDEEKCVIEFCGQKENESERDNCFYHHGHDYDIRNNILNIEYCRLMENRYKRDDCFIEFATAYTLGNSIDDDNYGEKREACNLVQGRQKKIFCNIFSGAFAEWSFFALIFSVLTFFIIFQILFQIFNKIFHRKMQIAAIIITGLVFIFISILGEALSDIVAIPFIGTIFYSQWSIYNSLCPGMSCNSVTFGINIGGIFMKFILIPLIFTIFFISALLLRKLCLNIYSVKDN